MVYSHWTEPWPGQELGTHRLSEVIVVHCLGSGPCSCLGPGSAQCQYTIHEKIWLNQVESEHEINTTFR